LRGDDSRDAAAAGAHGQARDEATPALVCDLKNASGMAAVFCLVLLPAIAAVGFMIKALQGQMSFGGAFAAAIFAVLTAFVFAGVLGMVKQAEDQTA
jgi:hypothetical protein